MDASGKERASLAGEIRVKCCSEIMRVEVAETEWG